MSTTLTSEYEKVQKATRQRMFESYSEDFFKRWQPKDPVEAAQFASQFFNLVRLIYQDAAEPFSQHLHEILKSLPVAWMQTK